jgi:hypothetical protein
MADRRTRLSTPLAGLAIYISSRTKAAHNKTVKGAMELQAAGRGGSKRKYALADIKADIANKRLFVRKGLPPTGGSSSTQPPRKGCGDPPPTPEPKPKRTPMGSAVRRRQQQRQQQRQQHRQHRLTPRHSLGGGSRPQRYETGR